MESQEPTKEKVLPDQQQGTMSVAYGAAQGILQSLSQAFDGVVKSTGKAIDNVWDHRPLLIDDGKSELRLKMHFKLTEPVLAEYSCKVVDADEKRHYGELFITPYHLCFRGEIYNPKGVNKPFQFVVPWSEVVQVDTKGMKGQKDQVPQIVPVAQGIEPAVIEVITAKEKHQFHGFGVGFKRAWNIIDHVFKSRSLFKAEQPISQIPPEYKPKTPQA